jgi:hypothetical protein
MEMRECNFGETGIAPVRKSAAVARKMAIDRLEGSTALSGGRDW